MELNRRKFLKVLMLGIAARWVSPSISLAAGDEDKPRSFRWRVPIAHLETVRSNLHFEGTITREDAKGSPLVFVFVGAVLLPYLADAVLALRREIVHGGVIIDTRGPEIVIKNDQRLDAGVIVVVSPSGTNLYEKEQIGDPSELVRALLKGK